MHVGSEGRWRVVDGEEMVRSQTAAAPSSEPLTSLLSCWLGAWRQVTGDVWKARLLDSIIVIVIKQLAGMLLFVFVRRNSRFIVASDKPHDHSLNPFC